MESIASIDFPLVFSLSDQADALRKAMATLETEKATVAEAAQEESGAELVI